MNILVATDFSESARLAVDSLLDEAIPENSQIRVVNIVVPVYVSSAIAGGYVESMLTWHAQFIKRNRALMDQKIAKIQKRFPGAQVTGDVIEGDPTEVIVNLAKVWDADLVLLGSHGHSAIGRFFLGSVAEEVTRYAPCSVRVVKHKSKKKQVRGARRKDVA